MKTKTGFLLIAAMLAIAPASSSRADDLFYIELGTAETESDAQAQWQAISEKKPKLLHDLNYAPRTVIHAGRKKLIHIQAGPIENKKDAQRLCHKLFRADISCFIVEGLTPEFARAPRQEVVNTPLPWLFEAPAAPVPGPKEEGGLLSSLFGPDEKPAAPATEAKIHVAEAIRVPLSTDEHAPSTRVVASQAIPAGASGWLTLDSFPSEAAASGFWKKLRASSPSTAVGLRVLIIRPEAQESKVALTIGSFPHETAANDFCEQAVKPLDESLNCNFSAQAPKAAAPASRNEEPGLQREIQKEKRLRAVQPKLYWVQVASGDSRRDAEESWNEILSANADILEGTRHSTISVDSDYIVRVGPLSTEEEATELCHTLKERHLECDVESGNN